MCIPLRSSADDFSSKLSAQGASAKVALRSLGRGEFEGVGLFSFLVTYQTAANCRASPLCFAKKQGNRVENLRFSSPFFVFICPVHFQKERAERLFCPLCYLLYFEIWFLTAAKDCSLMTCSMRQASSVAVFSSTPRAISIFAITVCLS